MQVISSYKEIIQNIGKVFDKGLQNQYLSRSIKKIVEYEKEKTFSEIKMLKKELHLFEKKYKMSSAEFHKKFENGDLDDRENYFEWSAIYQMHERAVNRLDILKSHSS